VSSQRWQGGAHSRDYVRRLLRVAEGADPHRYARAVRPMQDKVLQIVIEAAVDEEFYISASVGGLAVHARDEADTPDLVVRVSPRALKRILEGHETPVEAFFMGNLRARGSTKDLYMLHALFVALAEIAVTSPEVQRIIEEFQLAKQDT
jgi:putative sterol carrier protein